MSFENVSFTVDKDKQAKEIEIDDLSAGFRNLVFSETVEDSDIFSNLEKSLDKGGFSLASETRVSQIFNSNSLVCRSESFSKVMDLVLEQKSIILTNDEHANMCNVAHGEGFRVAMTEGFSGEEVGGAVKVVLTFQKYNLDSSEQVKQDDDLWFTKPNTAKVSLIGKGQINIEDLEMISFRFPVRFYPENLLTDSEKERLEDGGVSFIVRHYIKSNVKATH